MNQQPLARIVALADVYDALTSHRVYKAAFSPEAGREIIVAETGLHFDPAVVDAFLARFEDFQTTPAATQRANDGPPREALCDMT